MFGNSKSQSNFRRRVFHFGFVAVTLLSLILLQVPTYAITPDARRDIQTQYDRWSRAYMANDVDTLLEILTPDYTLTNADHETMTFKTYAAYLQLRKASPKDTTQYKTRITKLDWTPYFAEVHAVESMTTERVDVKSGRLQIVIHSHEYLDRWKLGGGHWRLYSTTTLKESTQIQKKG